jgi:metallophosphoesterase superfamily enzyme
VIEKSEVNTWEGYRKADRKNISWADGRIQDGYVDDDGTIVTKTLYQVKIWLVRRKPIAIEPVVTPVRISVSPNLYTFDQDRNETHVALFVPDMHIGFEREYQTGKLIPFHDRRALSVVAKIISLYPFDQIVFLGDNLDMADWSDKFARTPDFEQLTQPAIEELAWWLGLYRHANSETDMTYLEGNHEKRQEIMVSKHLPQAFHLKNVGGTSIFSSWSIPSLLGLEDLSIEWVGNYPDGSVWLSDTLVAVHGDSLSAQKIVESTDASVVFGHLHRFDQASKTRFHRGVPKIFTALCPGFLGKLDGAVPGSKKNQNWSQGLALAYYTDEEPPTIVHIPVRDGKAIVEGTIIEGDDLTDFILDDLDNRWNF